MECPVCGLINNLNLTPEVEAGLLAQAQASGKSPEEYLLSVVEEAVRPAQEGNRTATSSRQQAVRRMLEFGEKHRLSLGELVTRQLLRFKRCGCAGSLAV